MIRCLQLHAYSLTPPVLQEALKKDVNMIVSYHAPIFRPLRALTLSNPLQATLLRCAQAGISIYTPHTSLDATAGGINDWLAEGLGGKASALVAEKLNPSSGESEGAEGRLVTLPEPIAMNVLEQRVKTYLKLSQGEGQDFLNSIIVVSLIHFWD